MICRMNFDMFFRILVFDPNSQSEDFTKAIAFA